MAMRSGEAYPGRRRDEPHAAPAGREVMVPGVTSAHASRGRPMPSALVLAAVLVALVSAFFAVREADQLTSLDSLRPDDASVRQGIAVVVRAPSAVASPAHRKALAAIGSNL